MVKIDPHTKPSQVEGRLEAGPCRRNPRRSTRAICSSPAVSVQEITLQPSASSQARSQEKRGRKVRGVKKRSNITAVSGTLSLDLLTRLRTTVASARCLEALRVPDEKGGETPPTTRQKLRWLKSFD